MPEENSHFLSLDDRKAFDSAFIWAMQNHMEVEWFTEFIHNIRTGETFLDSIRHANREWDL